MSTNLGGVFSAIATPFTADGDSVDEQALRRLVDVTLAGGIHGLVPAGSTGEFTALDGSERRCVVEVVIDQAAGRVPVVPHTGAMTTREAVSLSKHAQACGAAAVMAVAPYYEPHTLDEARAYYESIAAAIDIPVMVYNLPVATGLAFTGEWLADLARGTGRAWYVKDTSGDFSQIQRFAVAFKDDFGAFVGWDTLLGPAFLSGVAGTVVGAANIIPAQIVEVWHLVQSGHSADAIARWRDILPIMEILTSGSYTAAVKAGMELVGLTAGPTRAPAAAIEERRRVELAAALARLGVIPAFVG